MKRFAPISAALLLFMFCPGAFAQSDDGFVVPIVAESYNDSAE